MNNTAAKFLWLHGTEVQHLTYEYYELYNWKRAERNLKEGISWNTLSKKILNFKSRISVTQGTNVITLN